MSNTIILHGGLRERYGEEFKLAVSDPLEAYRALDCQLDGFRGMVRSQSFYLVREMPNGTFALDEHTMNLQMDNCKLHFIPGIAGSDKGVGKLLLGVVIIGASLFIPGSTMLLGMAVQTMGIMTGIAIALGGLAMMMAPTPKTNSTDRDESYLFSGDTNPSGQNIPVPIAIGHCRIKGIAVASRIVTNQISTGAADFDPNLKNIVHRVTTS